MKLLCILASLFAAAFTAVAYFRYGPDANDIVTFGAISVLFALAAFAQGDGIRHFILRLFSHWRN